MTCAFEDVIQIFDVIPPHNSPLTSVDSCSSVVDHSIIDGWFGTVITGYEMSLSSPPLIFRRRTVEGSFR